jgi:hypothetical protein
MALRRLVRFPVAVALTSLSLILAAPHAALADDAPDASAGTSTPDQPGKVNWADEVRAAQVRPGEPINLIVHTAKDCVYCKRWEGSLGGKGDFDSWAKTHPDVHIYIVEREAIAQSEKIENYPPDIQWLYERRERKDKLKPMTPTFDIFTKRTIVWHSAGLRSWDQVFTSVKDLDSRRSPSGGE